MRVILSLLFTCFLFTHNSYALACSDISITNNSDQAVAVSGIYPDTKEVLNTLVFKPYMTQKISLATIRTCANNNSKVRCHAMWLACHKDINLTVKEVGTETILLSKLIQSNDVISFNNASTNDKTLIVLVNDIPQY